MPPLVRADMLSLASKRETPRGFVDDGNGCDDMGTPMN